jgi:formylglycine-generating enzyme required for sulfatase activity
MHFDSKIKGQVPKGDNRVMRGGSWNNPDASEQNCRTAYRNNNWPDNRNNNIGFRLVLQLIGQPDGCR